MGEVRCFVALELPVAVRSELSAVLSMLSGGSERFVKWVDAGSIHLTLKFLGNVSEEKVADITHAIGKAAGSASPFQLRLNGLGAFPNLNLPRVIWAGIGGEIGKVAALQKQIDVVLEPLGFPPEQRQFSPHLTLGRVREKATPSERTGISRKVGSTALAEAPPFTIESISFMKSTLTPSGAIYAQMANIVLDRK